MTRQDIERDYQVDAHGRIRTPGTFEGELIYVPYYWDAYLNGYADRDNGDVIGFDITPDDRAMFPELSTRKRTVRLYQRSDGFVCELRSD